MPWTKPYNPARNQRLDPELYRQAGRVIFITIRAYLDQNAFVYAPINQLILDTLAEEQERQNCSIFSYSLMPDHLHCLISPRQDESSVLTFTDQFKGKTTNWSWKFGWKGKLWQSRYYDHIVRTDEDLRAIAAKTPTRGCGRSPTATWTCLLQQSVCLGKKSQTWMLLSQQLITR